MLIDILGYKTDCFCGNVMDKQYVEERISTGDHYIIRKGGTFYETRTNYEPERFLIIVETETGEFHSVKCEPDLYYRKEIGDQIECEAFKGLFTGLVYARRGVN